MSQQKQNRPRNPRHLFPLVLTSRLEETKRYYSQKAEFRVVYDLPTYLQVAVGEEDTPQLCFMKPDAFPDGVTRPVFEGRGLVISIPTPDADEKFARLKELGAEVLSEPSVKPWGWKSFMAADPNGVVLDFFHVESNPQM